ncbi:hypothetical protein PGQ11_010919 [Apiospora arundinis]|uniref:Uncharacterized protein n=1 Tax=Apiospora arundinis TaxID=335852 RepID=A0ABR2HXY3_9PEZI
MPPPTTAAAAGPNSSNSSSNRNCGALAPWPSWMTGVGAFLPQMAPTRLAPHTTTTITTTTTSTPVTTITTTTTTAAAAATAATTTCAPAPSSSWLPVAEAGANALGVSLWAQWGSTLGVWGAVVPLVLFGAWGVVTRNMLRWRWFWEMAVVWRLFDEDEFKKAEKAKKRAAPIQKKVGGGQEEGGRQERGEALFV